VLITSPLSEHLFHRAILESGPPFGLSPAQSLKEAEAADAAVTGNASIESLRKLPAADLQHLVQAHGNYDASNIVDGWILPEAPARAFATGKAQPVDLIVGLNGRELSAFRIAAAAAASKQPAPPKTNASPSGAIASLGNSAGTLYGAWTWAALAKYLSASIVSRDAATDQGANDMVMACPIGALATLTTASGAKTYVYRFNRSIPGKGQSTLGAFHGLEIPFVFNVFQERSWNWLPFTEADYALSNVMETYWTNFAKTGDPSSAGVPAWPQWKDGSEDYMEFTPQSQAVARQSFSPSFCYLSPDRVRKGILEAKRP
jgi:para-nitrobenzyl esterase